MSCWALLLLLLLLYLWLVCSHVCPVLLPLRLAAAAAGLRRGQDTLAGLTAGLAHLLLQH
jgi:hypothetical protein